MPALSGVILDIDGTLVDSNDAHARAWYEAFSEAGITVPYEAIRRSIGMGGDKLMPAVSGIREDEPRGEAISKRREQIFKEKFLPQLKPTRGARALLKRMHDDGLRLAVASSAKQEELRHLLKICGADAYIETKTSSDDADRSKPDPDIVHVALKELGLPVSAVVMLGDTPYDVEAAERAGIGTIAVRCGGWDDEALRDAIAIYEDPADLLHHYETSPLGRRSAQVA